MHIGIDLVRGPICIDLSHFPLLLVKFDDGHAAVHKHLQLTAGHESPCVGWTAGTAGVGDMKLIIIGKSQSQRP